MDRRIWPDFRRAALVDINGKYSVQVMDGRVSGVEVGGGASVAKGWAGQISGDGQTFIDPMTGARTGSANLDVGVFKEVNVGGTFRGGSINDISGVQTGSYAAGELHGPLSIGAGGGYMTNSGVSTYAAGVNPIGSVTYNTGSGFGLSGDPMGGIGAKK